MKMENADSLKLKSAQTTDAGGLTFGPAWLRQLSSGDTNKNALPPSPGLAFQSSKHRYSREEMLAIYETIEKSLMQKSPPNLAEEFEELHKKELQRPVLLTPPSLEEQKFLSTCVNSQVVLNMYNKIQGQPGQSNSTSNSNGNSSRNGEGGSRGDSRGGSSGMRGSRGGGRGGGLNSERGRGRGGRGGSIRGGHEPQFKTIDEEGNQININTNSSTRGGSNGRGGSTGGYKGSYSRAAWDDREIQRDSNSSGGMNGEKRYSKAMAEDNWRSRAVVSEEDDASAEKAGEEGASRADSYNENEGSGGPSSNWRNSNEKNSSSNNNSTPSREWPSSKNYSQVTSSGTYSTERGNRDNYNKHPRTSEDSQPEWLDDDGQDNSMTFDNSGKFISVKELREKKPATEDKSTHSLKVKPTSRSQSKEESPNEAKAELASSKEPSRRSSEISTGEEKDMEKTTNENNRNKKLGSGGGGGSGGVNELENGKSEKTGKSSELLGETQSLDENAAVQKLSQMSLNEVNKKVSNDSVSAKDSSSIGPQASFESLQAIHQNLQQQQLKLKNELLLASMNTDPKRGAVPSDHQDADRWFYLDPQNQIQGSFSSEQMAGWFAAGYFTLNLMIKRGRDEKFTPLGVVSNNWGRIPFTSGPQPQQPQVQPTAQPQLSQTSSQQPQQQNWSKEQIHHQMQLFQRLQQMQLMPGNINLLRNELISQPQSASSMTNLGGVLQQLQQLQLQQNAALAAAVNLGPTTASQIIHDIRSKQEALINQFASTNNTSNNNQNTGNSNLNNLHQNLINKQHHSSLPDLDPAILGAAPSKSQSIWGDMTGSRQSPVTVQGLNPTPPPNQQSISPINNLVQAQSNSSSSSSLNNNQLGQFVQNNLDTNLIAQHIRDFSASNSNGNSNANNMINLMMSDTNIKNKIQRLFEQTKQDEERRRKQEEYQMKLKREEDEKRRIFMEEKMAKEAELKRLQEEERIREEQRKEHQRKKLAEIIIKQEEEKKKNDELKKKREEEIKLKQKEEKLKAEQKREQKKLELAEAERKLQEEAEKRRQEHYQEQMRKQAEYERLKLKQQQDQLNNLQLPAHANWANQQNNQAQQVQQAQLKSILEQQALESMQQRLLEQQKQAELMQMQQNNQSSWSSLFRGNAPPTGLGSPPAAKDSKEPVPVSLASIQAEQIKKEPAKATPVTMAAKVQLPQATQMQVKQQTVKTTNNNNTQHHQQSSAWGTNNSVVKQGSGNYNESGGYSNTNSNSNSSGGGFWTDISDKKSSKNNNNKNKNQFPDLPLNNHNAHNDKQHNKHAKKIAAIEESVQQIFLRNMTISEEFMKWCHEQLKDFHVELHIPTFVNFLREIESCNEIEEYVVNYLGESQHAKDFAHQFYINRESQIKQQNNLTDDQIEESAYSKESQFSKKQKKRSKGQRVDHQLLGFTVQPDPNLKNRGDIDPL